MADERGIPRAKICRDDPERHPQGVHRARDVHLPGGAAPAADHRHLRVLQRRGAALEHHLHLRLPHPRGGGDGGAGGRLHLRQRAGVRAARAATPGCDVDHFAPRLSFFFAAHNDLFEEVAKFRAARRLWARLMRERFGAGGRRRAGCASTRRPAASTLTAQQPLNNVVRVTVQALAAVLGGTQSLHTNGYDEALSLPTARGRHAGAAHAAGAAARERRRRHGGPARRPLLRGGAHHGDGGEGARSTSSASRRWAAPPAAIAYMQEEIHRAAYEHQLAVERGERVVVGVNGFQATDEPLRPRPAGLPRARDRRSARSSPRCKRRARRRRGARRARGHPPRPRDGTENLMPPHHRRREGDGDPRRDQRRAAGEWGVYRPA